MKLSKQYETKGNLGEAAQVAWCASLGRVSQKDAIELIYRAASILEHANDLTHFNLEIDVLNKAFSQDAGSTRHSAAMRRLETVTHLGNKNGLTTLQSKMGELCVNFTDMLEALGIFGLDKAQEMHICMELGLKCCKLCVAMGRLCSEQNEFLSLILGNFYISHTLCFLLGPGSWCPEWEPEKFCNEDGLLKVIHKYDYQIHGRLLKELPLDIDCFMMGVPFSLLGLYWGNIAGYKEYNEKLQSIYTNEYKLAQRKNYSRCWCEVWGIHAEAAPVLLVLGDYQGALSLLKSVGFEWLKDGFGTENFEAWFEAIKQNYGDNLDRTCELTFLRLILFLASDRAATSSIEVSEWIPTPSEFVQMQMSYARFQRLCFHEVMSFGAMAYMKLGRYDDAYELARLAVLPAQNIVKKTTMVFAYIILGQVAAMKGRMGEAETQFENALEEAKLSRLPVLRIIAARDWKLHVLIPSKRERGVAEAIIDAACTKMKKTRLQLSSVINATLPGVERGAAGPANECANNSNGEAASSSPGIFRPFRKKVAAVTKIRGAFSGKKTSEV